MTKSPNTPDAIATAAPSRLAGIECVRVLAILAVIVIHVAPFTSEHDQHSGRIVVGWWLNQASRFAVPFFFIMAGYFFQRSIDAGKSPRTVWRRYSRRLWLAFMGWSVVYGVVGVLCYGDVLAHSLGGLDAKPKAVWEWALVITVAGPRAHLFFLPSLWMGLAAVALLGKGRMLAVWSLFLFGVGLLGGSYAHTAWGLDLGIDSRNGPFFSTLHVALGVWLSRRQMPPIIWGVILAIIGGLLQWFEARGLWLNHGISPLEHDFLFATPLFGLGVAMLAIGLKDFGANTFLPTAGGCTLGVYLGHMMIIEIYLITRQNEMPHGSPTAQLLAPLCLYLMTLGAVALLARVRFLRPWLI